jgi:amino acid transporter
VLVLYGTGTIVGAGIFVLVGAVADRAGSAAPASFLLAGIVAAFTAFSYGELAARYPVSAGEAVYVESAFNRRWLAAAIGYAIIFTGIVSGSTLARGFFGYLLEFVQAPEVLAIGGIVVGLGVVAAIGIELSAGAVAVMSIIQIAGLALFVALASDALGELPARWPELFPELSLEAFSGVFLGALLAFYSFIGFEDMVNLAEEVREPERTLPRGILLALLAATVLYLVVVTTAVLALPVTELAESDAPLAAVLEQRGAPGHALVAVVGLLATANSLLVQVIMASRVAYGMGRRGLAPELFSTLHGRTQTPLLATAGATGAVLAFALWLPLVLLAQLTSVVILMIFAAVNAALWWLKRTDQPEGVPNIPRWVPAIGVLLSSGLVVLQVASWARG